LSVHRDAFVLGEGNAIRLCANPVELLDDLYHFLNMDFHSGRHAQNVIWDHDQRILASALEFYRELNHRLQTNVFESLQALLAKGSAPKGAAIDAQQWQHVQAAHAGYQAGAEVLKLLPYVAAKTGFYQLSVAPDLSIDIPERLLDENLQKSMQKVLAPPPTAKSDEIIASTGGMYYPREAPGKPAYINEGDHFEAGDVLYIVEVMKMFNKVVAPFAGSVEKILVEGDGVIIAKGQTLFKVKPDEEIVIEAPEEIIARRRAGSHDFLNGNV
ncbi:MAG: acetyl-CoA carboxylase biotin carboxyl carrier protein subunit, partial [Pseudomonadales bacterium]|nr:acetyl-CoA carboxylase biotin carboxyl carrier protein subunit [Pseudomonadales bacterium]